MILILIIFIYLIVTHYHSGKNPNHRPMRRCYSDVLVERYINNEINDEEYLRMKEVLKRK
jgi:uncharacterized membrane protein